MDRTESIHIKKEKSKKQSKKLHKIIVLIVVIALSFLIATQWISVLRIQSSSMSPTIDAGQIVTYRFLVRMMRTGSGVLKGGTSTSISLSKNILNSAKVDPDPILGYSTNVFSLIKYCKNLELKTSLLGEMHKTRPSL